MAGLVNARHRWALHGLALLVAVAAAFGGRVVSAAADGPDDVAQVAAQYGIDPQALAGAVNTTRLDPRTYLCRVGEAPCPTTQPAGYPATVRVTHYLESGTTYSGGHTYPGSTACSWNFALGTRFQLPDGETFTCNDRGLLGSTGWLDLWRRPDLSHAYGPYVTVLVLP